MAKFREKTNVHTQTSTLNYFIILIGIFFFFFLHFNGKRDKLIRFESVWNAKCSWHLFKWNPVCPTECGSKISIQNHLLDGAGDGHYSILSFRIFTKIHWRTWNIGTRTRAVYFVFCGYRIWIRTCTKSNGLWRKWQTAERAFRGILNNLKVYSNRFHLIGLPKQNIEKVFGAQKAHTNAPTHAMLSFFFFFCYNLSFNRICAELLFFFRISRFPKKILRAFKIFQWFSKNFVRSW